MTAFENGAQWYICLKCLISLMQRNAARSQVAPPPIEHPRHPSTTVITPGSDVFGSCACAGSRSTRASGSCADDRHNINSEIRDEERAFRVPSFGSWDERMDGVERGRRDGVLGTRMAGERSHVCCRHLMHQSWVLAFY